MYVVTGAAGFIGSNIVKGLNERGIDNILAVDDLTHGDKFRNLASTTIANYMDIQEFQDAIQDGNTLDFEAVLHNGACANTMEQDGKYMMERNFTFSRMLFEYCTEQSVPFVYASSASVYGTGRDSREEPACERPINVYAYSKLAFDQYVRKRLPNIKSTVVGLRYFNVYGPHESSKGRMASMVFQMWKHLEETGRIRLFEGTDGYADGGQMRDFVCVNDVVNVNLHFAKEVKAQGIVNVGTGTARSFNDVAAALLTRKFGEIDPSSYIDYIPFPESLHGKYQSFTEARLDRLRALDYNAPFLDLDAGVDASIQSWTNEIN